ncbi:MAG: hypothetical protein CMJ81_13625 [Planctomycetaceae bacterium]|nr:hypothetical protein [Planctomycetaceae bacterium]
MLSREKNSQGGFTIAELAFGLMIFAISASALINHIGINFTVTRDQKDRVFAFAKAQAILSEIQSYVDRGEISAAIELDSLDDGQVNKPVLTITKDSSGNLVLPDHPLSQNSQRNGEWIWSRRITVQPFSGLNNRNVRYVTVRIYKKDRFGRDHPMADLSSVVNSVGSAFPSSQVYDLYLFAIENIPGWWVFMETIVPFVESAITDLESRNPGLTLRTHWITKASYGRNAVYRPYINENLDSTNAVTDVYYYPGLMPEGSASSYYYVPDLIKARMSFDGVEKHGYDANTNPYPYALADFYNHAMRYPREKAFHDVRVAAIQQRRLAIEQAKASSSPPPVEFEDMSEEPTLRLLLEDLSSNPDKYKHALIINLHGELVPMPSLRNYSDAAKLPDLVPDVRVVTHPEELRTLRDPGGISSEDVRLRVYGYTTSPTTYLGPTTTSKPIAVQVMGVDLTDETQPNGLIAGCTVEDLQGGVSVAGDLEYYPFTTSKRSGDGPVANEMYYDVSFVNPGAGEEKFTLFKLYNTPVVSPEVSSRGLTSDTRSRLYGLEYVPSCTEASLDFSRDLYTTGVGPKNTARWVVHIPSAVFGSQKFVNTSGTYYDPAADVTLTVRTRIWDDSLPEPLDTGTMWPVPVQPDNFSETYTWWADSSDDVPLSERSQFQGDPRHNPYKDLWTGDPDFPDGYNWYHDSLANDGENSYLDYPGLDASLLRNRWQGSMRQDVPRFFGLLRTGIVNSQCVYNSVTGFSYYYMGHGNEIGYDSSNGYPFSIPVNLGPWSNSTESASFIDNVTGYRNYVLNLDTPYWWGITWLGELYPDHVYASQWMALDTNGKVRGNLDCGQAYGANSFFRWWDEGTYASSAFRAYGTKLYSGLQRTGSKGCTSFFNVSNTSPAGTFTHNFSGGDGWLADAGTYLASNYNFSIPSSTPVSRPFVLDSSTSKPEEWNYDPYATDRYTASLVHTFYAHGDGTGSGLVEFKNPDETSAGYVIVNGVSQTTSSGSSFIVKFSLLTMLHSFFEAGDGSLPFRIKMPARVEILTPTEISELDNPELVTIQWDVYWARWDGKDYAPGMSSHVEDESEMEYVIMYSRDGGTSWLHVQDDSVATIGSKSTNPYHIVADSGAGIETFDFSTPEPSFPAGTYLLRIECYRAGQSLHYSQHQAKIFIQR